MKGKRIYIATAEQNNNYYNRKQWVTDDILKHACTTVVLSLWPQHSK